MTATRSRHTCRRHKGHGAWPDLPDTAHEIGPYPAQRRSMGRRSRGMVEPRRESAPAWGALGRVVRPEGLSVRPYPDETGVLAGALSPCKDSSSSIYQVLQVWHGIAAASRTTGPHHFPRRGIVKPRARPQLPPKKIVTPIAAGAVASRSLTPLLGARAVGRTSSR